MSDNDDQLDPLRVHDRDSFFAFVRALVKDREASLAANHPLHSPYSPDPYGWENITIESYLSAALSWAESTNMGERQGVLPSPSWQAFAVFLHCGKIYE